MTTTAPAFQIVPRGDVHPSPLNPRKSFDPAKLQELADSMADGKGIIEPLVVRPRAAGGYELIAGERRWRASELAGLTEVPIVVRSLKDHEVLELMLIENKQRADLGPLEEAESYKQLMSLTNYDVDEVAAKIGMSTRYVYDSVKLLQLTENCKRLLSDGRITRSHAIPLSRLSSEDQERVIDPDNAGGYGSRVGVWAEENMRSLLDDEESDRIEAARESGEDPWAGLKICSVRELEAFIAEKVRFDPELPVNQDLFPETVEAIKQAEERPGRGRKVISITFDHRVDDEAKDPDERTYGRESWRLADGSDKKAPTCDYSVLGLVRAGRHRGQFREVCVNRDKCKVHFKEAVLAREKREKEKAKAAKSAPSKSAGDDSDAADKAAAREVREAEKERAKREALSREHEAVTAAIPALEKATAAAVKRVALTVIIAQLTTRGELYFGASPEMKQAEKLLPGALSADLFLRRLLLSDLLFRIDDEARGGGFSDPRKDVKETLKPFGVDVDAIVDAHLPKPAAEKAAPAKTAKKSPAKKATKKTTKKGAAKR